MTCQPRLASEQTLILDLLIMLDFFWDLRKSSEEKQQEALNAYLDDALAPQQRRKIEENLDQDMELQAQLEQMRALQQQMRQLPQRQVPRNFTLDPADYGRPAKEPLSQAYPVLRTATVLTAFIFVFVLAANLFLGGTSMQSAGSSDSVASVAQPEMETAVEESMDMEAASEIVVEEAEAVEAVEESEEAAEEAISGEMEMPAEAQQAPSAEEIQEEALPFATLEPDDELREMLPEVESTIVANESVADEAAGAATMDSETEPSLIPPEGLPEVEQESLRDPSSNIDGMVGYGIDLSTLILLILGLAFIVLLFLTLLARRRL